MIKYVWEQIGASIEPESIANMDNDRILNPVHNG
jgi:hypothetical protein